MKKYAILILFIFSAALANAQLRKIPASVTNAFAIKYPHAENVEWRDKLHYFEATFMLNNIAITASFSSKGEWEASERKLNFSQLPDEVKDGFGKSKYAERQTNAAYEMQELGKPLQYRINVQKSGIQKKNLFFDANGKLLKEALAF